MKNLRIFLRRLIKILLSCIVLVLTTGIVICIFSYTYYSVGYHSIKETDKTVFFSGTSRENIILTDSGSSRRTGNTFMSIPEWYIVSISEDYTDWLEWGNNPSNFPYFSYLRDYWILYGKITALMDGNIPRDYEYHMMIQVIGVSTTLEFGLKWIYENSIGRLTSLLSFDTPEDQYYTQISRKYVDFILLRPWYEFDYSAALWGFNFSLSHNFLRSMERYILYSLEFWVKKFYAKIIEDATHSSFATPDTWTEVQWVFDTWSMYWNPEVIQKTSGGIKILRYYPFTTTLPKIINHSWSQVETIAWNKKIMVEYTSQDTSGIILSIPIPVSPLISRNFLYTEVSKLSSLIHQSGSILQHIYDF